MSTQSTNADVPEGETIARPRRSGAIRRPVPAFGKYRGRAPRFSRWSAACAVTALGLLFVGHASAQERSTHDSALHGFVSVGTADVFRGLQRHRDGLAVQAALRWAITDRVFVGAHVAPAEFIKPDGRVSDDVELDYYIGLWHELGDDAALQLRLTRYTYPGSDDVVEYDYDEFSLGVEIGARWLASLSVERYALPFADYAGAAEIQWRTALGRKLEASAALGGARYFDSTAGGYGYWDVGISRPVGPVTADLRYHYSPRRDPWFGRKPAGGTWALSLTAGW